MRLIAIVSSLAGFVLLVAGCSPHVYKVDRRPCNNRFLHESAAPSGNAKAVVFERQCMTSTTIQVSLLPADARFSSDPGNTFVAGAGKGSLQGRPVVSVAWSGPTRVTISYTKGAAVMRSEGRVGQVDVGYAFLDAGGAPVARAPQTQGSGQP